MTESEKALFAALKALHYSCPSDLPCYAFHHSKKDRHTHSEDCPPREEYLTAQSTAWELIKKMESKK
jgi:hypothetical protein